MMVLWLKNQAVSHFCQLVDSMEIIGTARRNQSGVFKKTFSAAVGHFLKQNSRRRH